MTSDEIMRRPAFRLLFAISVAKYALKWRVSAELQLRFLGVIERFMQLGGITPAAVSVLEPACPAAAEIFRESRGEYAVLDRPEVRQILVTLNPSLVSALQLIDPYQRFVA